MRRSDFRSHFDARFRSHSPESEARPGAAASTDARAAILNRLQTVATGVLKRTDLFEGPARQAMLEELAVIASLADARTINWPLLYIRVARLVAQITPFDEELPAVIDALRTLEVEVVSWAPRQALRDAVAREVTEADEADEPYDENDEDFL